MKRGRRIWIVLLACGVVALVTALVWPREREPSYQGKKLSFWVTRSFKPDSNWTPTVSQEDMVAILAMGTNAVPFLARWSVEWEPGWVVKVEQIGVKIGIRNRKAAEGRRERRRNRAANSLFALGQVGPEATLGFPEFANYAARIGGTNLANPARESLYRLMYYHQLRKVTIEDEWGRVVSMDPVLAGGLKDGNPIVREEALRASNNLVFAGVRFLSYETQPPGPNGVAPMGVRR